MILLFVRALIIYIVILIAMRMMGKRQVGQLQPFEFAITLLVAEVGAIPLSDTSIPLLNGIVTIITLLFAQLLFSYVSLKSDVARNFISGRPVILISNGKINESELVRQKYNINDLIEQLRVKDYPNIDDIEFAILENNGQISVIPKSQKRPVTPEDLNIETDYEGMTYDLIIDGKVFEDNLVKLNLDVTWLKNELKKFNVNNFENILYAGLDTKGNLFYQEKEELV